MLPLVLVALLAAPPSPAPRGAAVDPAYVTFVEALEHGINVHEADALDAHIDRDQLLDRATRGVSTSKQFAEGFRRGVKTSASGMLGKQMVSSMDEESTFHLLRLRMEDGAPRALFRFLTPAGMNYFDFELARSAAGEVAVVDVYVYVSGERFSETIRRLYLTAAAEADRGLLDRVLGKEQEFLKAAPKLKQMQQLMQQQKYKEVLAAFTELPAVARKEKSFQLIRMTAAGQVDEAEYRKAISEFEQLFPGDPALDLVSLDGYFLRKDWTGALRTLARLDKRVQDPYLQVLRGNVLVEKGDLKEAKARFQAAIDAEPTLMQAYWILVSLSLQESAYKETARLLTAIERDAGLEIGELGEIAEYSGFVKSPEYKAWLKRRAKP